MLAMLIGTKRGRYQLCTSHPGHRQSSLPFKKREPTLTWSLYSVCSARKVNQKRMPLERAGTSKQLPTLECTTALCVFVTGLCDSVTALSRAFPRFPPSFQHARTHTRTHAQIHKHAREHHLHPTACTRVCQPMSSQVDEDVRPLSSSPHPTTPVLVTSGDARQTVSDRAPLHRGNQKSLSPTSPRHRIVLLALANCRAARAGRDEPRGTQKT